MLQSRSRRERAEAGSALLVSLILLLLLVMLGAALLGLSRVESAISHNELWSDSAFHAAEAGLHAGIDQLTPDPAVAAQPVAETLLTETCTYRSGGRLDTTAQPLQFLGTRREAGFSLGMGTGYNTGGYTFARYRINATGVHEREARREVEALVRYGPVAE